MIECSKNIDLYVDMRLKRWGAWCEKMATGGLGYPSSSAFTKIGEARNYQVKSVELIDFKDEEAEETEEAFNELYKYKRKIAEVIRINYVSSGRLREKCQKCGLSYDGFKKQLAIGRAFMSGLLIRR